MMNPTSRRHFFFGTLLAGAVPAAGYGSVPSLRALGYKPFYEKLNVAAVGCGGQGGFILNQAAQTENIVAMCDVDEKRAADNFNKFPKATKYKDFREMIDKEGKNIDALTIGIPDHMHATVALYAMQRGKHVYVEKPLTRTPWEARLLQQAAAKYKVATQMGNQGWSHESIRVASEIVWSGEIGDVTEVHASSSPGTHPTGLDAPPAETSVPSNLNWDLWLGQANMRAYAAEYTPYNWRGFYDFGTGQIGNWGIHTMGPVHMALQLDAPLSVEMVTVEGSSKISFPKRAVIKFEFGARGKMPPVTVYWHDSSLPNTVSAFKVPGMEGEKILPSPNNLADKGRVTAPPRAANAQTATPRPPIGTGQRWGAGGPGVPLYGPGGSAAPPEAGILSHNGALFIGKNGMMSTVDRGEGVQLLPKSRWESYQLPPQLLTRQPGGHMLDWVRACKGGSMSVSDFSASAPFAEWMVLGAIAMRVGGGKLLWDSKNIRFTNSAEANKYVQPAFRKGWELKL
ncbi:MAG: Gfo/Idh/MocA family oxidoreductase [Acidobacteria bacterium]|nr:Gfo/Idh/MocA family oxidoreductase [Acidobacteriota bacterium]